MPSMSSYNDEHLMDKVTGTGNAKLISHATGSVDHHDRQPG